MRAPPDIFQADVEIGKQKERASKVNAAFFAAYGGNEHTSRTLKIGEQ